MQEALSNALRHAPGAAPRRGPLRARAPAAPRPQRPAAGSRYPPDARPGRPRHRRHAGAGPACSAAPCRPGRPATAAGRGSPAPRSAGCLTIAEGFGPDSPMIRIMLADDQAMVRQGFGALLNAQQGMAVVGEVTNGEDAVRTGTSCGRDAGPDGRAHAGDGRAGGHPAADEPARRRRLPAAGADADDLRPRRLRVRGAPRRRWPGSCSRTPPPTTLVAPSASSPPARPCWPDRHTAGSSRSSPASRAATGHVPIKFAASPRASWRSPS